VYDSGTRVASVAMVAGSSSTLAVNAGAITFGGVACDVATTSNTDTIVITGTAGTTETLVLDMSGGAFAPGATAETAPNLSEIEIGTSLGDAADVIVVRGTAGDDTIRVGSNGVGLNADSDVDVSFAPLPAQIEILGLGGANTLSARGNFGTGTIYLGVAVLRAGNDPGNVLEGGNGNDQLYGGASNDRLDGRDGNDLLNGGAGNDQLLGSGGDDTMIGGAGADEFLGAAGIDTFFANDDEADVAMNGGPDADTATYDLGIDPTPVAMENHIHD
jgi:Ca2+-binding RTX toxin-like protein